MKVIKQENEFGLIISFKDEIGIEKLIPSTLAFELIPLYEYFATLIPITSPLAFNNAPPLLPPLIAASV